MLYQMLSTFILVEVVLLQADFVQKHYSKMAICYIFWQIHKHRYDFNQKLLNLRDKKICIIDEIRTLVGRLQQVQLRLGADHSLPLPPIPRLHHDEMPEKYVLYHSQFYLHLLGFCFLSFITIGFCYFWSLFSKFLPLRWASIQNFWSVCPPPPPLFYDSQDMEISFVVQNSIN